MLRASTCLLALLMSALSFQVTASENDHAPFAVGTHYRILDNPVSVSDGDKIEVREFFFYGCPHCYHVEPIASDWIENRKGDDVTYVRTPVLFIRGAEPLARAFYVAQAKGILDEVHMPIFHAIHKHRENLNSLPALANFFRAYGVEPEEFNSLYTSFGVSTRIRQADALTRDYQLTGTPAFTVAGKYVVLRTNLSNDRETFQVIEYLVDKERQARK